jgi:hypothetical protein
MARFMYIPFWRTGGWEDISYRTQLYLTPLSRGRVRLGVFLFENGGTPWAGKELSLEIDQAVGRVATNADGMLEVDMGPGQTVRIEINALEHEYGTGEVHLLDGEGQVPMLARGDLEVFAQEAAGFEMSVSEISITGARPTVLERV